MASPTDIVKPSCCCNDIIGGVSCCATGNDCCGDAATLLAYDETDVDIHTAAVALTTRKINSSRLCTTCITCSCKQCSCRSLFPPKLLSLNSTRSARLQIGLPTGSVPSKPSELLPSCIVDPEAYARCAHGRRCALRNVGRCLAVEVPEVRGVTVAKEYDTIADALLVDVYFKTHLTDWLAVHCRDVLLRRGYKSVELVSASQETLAAKSKAGPFPTASLTQTVFHLHGLTCGSCVRALENTLSKVDGIVRDGIQVTLDPQRATITHDPSIISVKALAERIEGIGYEVINTGLEEQQHSVKEHLQVDATATLKKTTLAIHGMTCASCVGTLENMLRGIEGVDTSSVIVTLFPQRAIVSHNTNVLSADQLSEAIQDIGYEVLSVETEAIRDGVLNIVSEAAHEPQLVTTKLTVGGMTCASCVAGIEAALGRTPGVQDVVVNLMTSQANIKHNAAIIGARDLISLVENLGYDADLAPKTSSGDLLRLRDGAERRSYRNQVLLALTFTLPTFIIGMVIMMALPPQHPARMALMKPIAPGLSVDAIVLFVLATPVQFWLGRRFYIGSYKSLVYAKTANMDVLVALGTSAAYFYSVYSVVYGVASATEPQPQFFETSILLIFFILLGKYLESYAKGKTSDAITKLMQLAPDKATVIISNSNDQEVSIEQEVDIGLVQVGDVLKVSAGGRVPCDSVIVRGTTFIDESMLTGEPIPVAKTIGDAVMGGTVNQNAVIHVKAVVLPSEGTLSRIIRLVEDAQSSRAPIQAVADAISRYFVPAVVFVSLITLVVWVSVAYAGVVPEEWYMEIGKVAFALDFAIAVLVIACPCSLGLATPTAVMVGTGVGAKLGILIKGGGAALEMAHQVKAIAFDKTGTLTMGLPTVTEAECWITGSMPNSPIMSEGDFWSLVATIESGSDHPLARAVSSYAKNEAAELNGLSPISVDELVESAGKGLAAVIESPHTKERYMAFVGSRRWMEEQSCIAQDQSTIDRLIDQWQSEGKSLVYVGMRPVTSYPSTPAAGHLLGIIAVADTIRKEAPAVVQALQRRGISVWMVTGDNEKTAHAVARQLGINEEQVLAQILPGEKAEKIKWLQSITKGRQKNGRVAMTGDGINDSVALAQADVGIAIGTGSDVAIESAQAVLVKSNLWDVLTLLDLSRTVFTRIKINFAWAFGYNLVGLPLAAGVFYPWARIALAPWMAGLAMALSSVCVVLSSLALKLYRPPNVIECSDQNNIL